MTSSFVPASAVSHSYPHRSKMYFLPLMIYQAAKSESLKVIHLTMSWTLKLFLDRQDHTLYLKSISTATTTTANKSDNKNNVLKYQAKLSNIINDINWYLLKSNYLGLVVQKLFPP